MVLEWIAGEFATLFSSPTQFDVRYVSGHPSFAVSDTSGGRLVVLKKTRDVQYYGPNDKGFVISRDLITGVDLADNSLKLTTTSGDATVDICFDLSGMPSREQRQLIKLLRR